MGICELSLRASFAESSCASWLGASAFRQPATSIAAPQQAKIRIMVRS